MAYVHILLSFIRTTHTVHVREYHNEKERKGKGKKKDTNENMRTP
jgi:hypothetical protein